MQAKPRPLATTIAILLSVIGIVIAITGQTGEAVAGAGFFPFRITEGSAQFSNLAFVVPAFLTPISAAFIEISFFNLLLSVVVILLIGSMLEEVLGTLGFGVLCLAAVYASAILVWASNPQSAVPMFGSDAIFSAVLASYIILFPQQFRQRLGNVSSDIAWPLQLLLMWTIFQVAFMLLSPGTPFSAILPSIMGFIIGLALARPILLWRYRKA